MQKLLFLCTGNYYRSRFAEHLFNHLAVKAGLDWQADSRGLALERGVNNVGPISPYAIAQLELLGIKIAENERFPLSASDADFATADRAIALDESEHRPLMSVSDAIASANRYPQREAAVEYWLVHDVDITPATTALTEIEKRIRQLVTELA
jgi:protein-tyrosine phosphatase